MSIANNENKEICFDMDGTIANFYGVDGWLNDLENFNPRPYREAKPLINMNTLAKQLNRLQKVGYRIKIISWSSKKRNSDFDKIVEIVKKKWLDKHLHSVHFDEIHVLPYGTPKEKYGQGILFDDEIGNRTTWGENAYDETDIINILKTLS